MTPDPALKFAPCGRWDATSARTHMGYEVFYFPLSLAGGKSLAFPFTDAGPLPAEDEHFKIDVASFLLKLRSDSSGKPSYRWRFVERHDFFNRDLVSIRAVAIHR